jgi:ribosomal protein S16
LTRSYLSATLNCGRVEVTPVTSDGYDGGAGVERLYALPPSYHRLESYLASNADELEHYITQGATLNQAVNRLHKSSNGNRPTCASCGGVIKRARRSAIFCRQHNYCRRYARRYTYLYQEKGLSKTEALAQIFQEIT